MPEKKYITSIKINNTSYNMKDTEAQEDINSLENSSLNVSFGEEEIILGTGKRYDYEQNGNDVTINNSPFVQQANTVIIQ